MTINELSKIACDFCNAYEIDADDFFKKGMYHETNFNSFKYNYDIFLRGRKAEEQRHIESEEISKTINIALATQLDEMKAVIKKHHLQRFFK